MRLPCARTSEVTWSDELYDIFGLKKSQFGGTHEDFAACVHPEDRPRVVRISTQACTEGLPFNIEYRIVTSAGDLKVIQEIARPTLDDAGHVVSLVGTAQDITEQKKAAEALKNSHAQLQALSARLQRVREEEVSRIAREIHDDLGQKLTALKMDLLRAERKIEELETAPATNSLLDTIVAATELVDEIAAAVQEIAANLRPEILDKLGLNAALRAESRRFQERTGILCEARVPEIEPILSTEVSTALFRIFQECLTNVARHARASEVKAELKAEPNSVTLSVQDNGCGIAPTAMMSPHSLGLLGMKERAALLGGEVVFQAGPDNGTSVTTYLPRDLDSSRRRRPA